MSGQIIEDKSECEKFENDIKEMEKTVKSLEKNLKGSENIDNQMLMSLNTEKIKFEGLTNQLEEALKENKHLLNILQLKSGENDLSRTNSQIDLSSSCSTMSIVHLQYKYEELVASYHGLLKFLELKSEEIKKLNEENCCLKSEIEQLKASLSSSMEKVHKLQTKLTKLKERKDEKINKLKTHKDTLQLVHNQLVDLLHNQCMEKDHALVDEIQHCKDSDKALLLQEARKNNLLTYQNFQLNQKVEYLKSLLKMENKSGAKRLP